MRDPVRDRDQHHRDTQLSGAVDSLAAPPSLAGSKIFVEKRFTQFDSLLVWVPLHRSTESIGMHSRRRYLRTSLHHKVINQSINQLVQLV